MEKKVFTTVNTYALTLDNLYGLADKSVDYCELMRVNMEPLTQDAFDILVEDRNVIEKRMKKNMASILTPEIRQMDKRRKVLFSEIKQYIKVATRSSVPAMQAAGMKLYDVVKPYWKINVKPVNTITSALEELFTRYKTTPLLKNDAKTISIEAQMSTCELANKGFDAMYKERIKEESLKVGNAASEMKDKLAKSYDQFCTLIEFSVNLRPTPEIESLFLEMDRLRKKYSALK